jgi:hypothetical protein
MPSQDNVHSFTLIFDTSQPLSADEVDTLFEAGCDDAVLGRRNGVVVADFDRASPSFGAAVWSAVTQVERAVPGLRVARVEPEDLVGISDIAARTKRTRESVRLLVEGRRGPGGFPAPAVWLAGDRRLWHWADVNGWWTRILLEKLPDEEDLGFVRILNSLLDLRQQAHKGIEPQATQVVVSVLKEIGPLLGHRHSPPAGAVTHGRPLRQPAGVIA